MAGDGVEVLSAERTVEVVVRLRAPKVTLPDGRTIRPWEVKLIYAGNGYVRVEVRGRSGHGWPDTARWSHMQGAAVDPGNQHDTSRAPEWVRELVVRYAPPDFVAVA